MVDNGTERWKTMVACGHLPPVGRISGPVGVDGSAVSRAVVGPDCEIVHRSVRHGTPTGARLVHRARRLVHRPIRAWRSAAVHRVHTITTVMTG